MASMEPGALAGSETTGERPSPPHQRKLQWSPALWPGVSVLFDEGTRSDLKASMEPGALAGSERVLSHSGGTVTHSFNGARRFGRE